MRISDWSSDVCSSDLALWSALPTIALWFAVLILLSSQEAVAQDTAPTQARAEASAEAPQTAIAARADGQSDADIRGRIRSIFSEVAGLRGVEVRVSSGVVTLTGTRSEEHTSELQSLMRISYAVFCLKKKT